MADHPGRWARIVERLPAFRLCAGLARVICGSQASIPDLHWNSLPSHHTAGANCLPQDGKIDVVRMPRKFITGWAGNASMLRRVFRWVGRPGAFGEVPVAIPCVPTKDGDPAIQPTKTLEYSRAQEPAGDSPPDFLNHSHFTSQKRFEIISASKAPGAIE